MTPFFQGIAFMVPVACVAIFIGWGFGYRAANRFNRSLLKDGERYREIMDEALRQCAPAQKVEIWFETRIPARDEQRGRVSMGIHEKAPE